MSTSIALLFFLILSTAVILVACRLSYYADYLGSITRINKGFIGLFLLATATSLPEFFTSLTAVLTVEEGAALAGGNVFGSNCFNLIIIFTAFFIHGLLPNIKNSQHFINGLFIQLFTLLILLKTLYPPFMRIGMLDLSMWLIVVLYFFSLWIGKKTGKIPVHQEPGSNKHTISFFWGKLSIAVILLVVLAYSLTQTVDVLSIRLEWGHSFGGYLFLAFATSLPETATVFSSMKYDINLSLGNILGSNIFNPMILAFLQVILPHRSILEGFTLSNHLAMILSLVLLCLLVGFIYLPKTLEAKSLRFWRMIILATIVLFIAGSYGIYITSLP